MKDNKTKLPFDNWDHTFVIAEAGSNWRAGEYKKEEEMNDFLIKLMVKEQFQISKKKMGYRCKILS